MAHFNLRSWDNLRWTRKACNSCYDIEEGEDERNCRYIEREALWAIYRIQEKRHPNPRLLVHLPLYPYILNTPSQMQRECNDVAFGELTLSTRLKRNKKKIHPSLKSWYRRSVQLLNMSCRWAPPQEGIAFTNQYLSKYLESSQTSTSTPQTRALLWRIEHDKNNEMCQTSQR